MSSDETDSSNTAAPRLSAAEILRNKLAAGTLKNKLEQHVNTFHGSDDHKRVVAQILYDTLPQKLGHTRDLQKFKDLVLNARRKLAAEQSSINARQHVNTSRGVDLKRGPGTPIPPDLEQMYFLNNARDNRRMPIPAIDVNRHPNALTRNDYTNIEISSLPAAFRNRIQNGTWAHPNTWADNPAEHYTPIFRNLLGHPLSSAYWEDFDTDEVRILEEQIGQANEDWFNHPPPRSLHIQGADLTDDWDMGSVRYERATREKIPPHLRKLGVIQPVYRPGYNEFIDHLKRLSETEPDESHSAKRQRRH